MQEIQIYTKKEEVHTIESSRNSWIDIYCSKCHILWKDKSHGGVVIKSNDQSNEGDGGKGPYSETLCSLTTTIFQGHRDDYRFFKSVNNVEILSLPLEP